MRFLLKLSLDQAFLPQDYRPLIVSVFKGCIQQHADEKHYQALYTTGVTKPLSWSIRLHQPKFNGEIIQLASNDLDVTLSITDAKVALIYFSSLVAAVGSTIPVINRNQLVIRSIKMLPDKQINSDSVMFKLFSPLCLRDHDRATNKDFYYSVSDEGFLDKLKSSIASRVSVANRCHLDKLQLDVSGLKRIIVTLYGQKIAVSIGTIAMQAPSSLLNEIYQQGLGVRQPSGFGLLGIVGEMGGEH